MNDRTPTLVTSHEAATRRAGRPPVPAAQRDAFLLTLAETHSITEAAKAAGYSRWAFHRLRRADPDFSTAWDAAMDSLPGRVMDAMLRLARLDDEQPEQAPTFKLFDKFHGRPNVAIQNNVGVGVQQPPAVRSDRDAERLLAKLKEELKLVIDAEVLEVKPEDGSDLI